MLNPRKSLDSMGNKISLRNLPSHWASLEAMLQTGLQAMHSENSFRIGEQFHLFVLRRCSVV
jgi:hypothetical protein